MTRAEKNKVYQARYREKHREKIRARVKARYWASSDERERSRKNYAESKKTVLTHYGPQHLLICSWNGCLVMDIDMLTLDHINNDGCEERRHRHRGAASGAQLYMKLIRENFPEGYQTLCANHQFKKELMRRRSLHV
jgi:hypothetical protein